MSQDNNKRIAKNTLLLYFRTIFIMFISLLTSRVVLNALGVENYGIYNVVGGVVAMFSLISGSLSSSISRFITFELGKGNIEKLKVIFSTSINIQIGISLIILLLGEIIGGWFLNTHMNIPEGRMEAATVVYYKNADHGIVIVDKLANIETWNYFDSPSRPPLDILLSEIGVTSMEDIECNNSVLN